MQTISKKASTAQLADRLGDLLRELFLDPDADHLGAIEERELTLTQVRGLLVVACAAEHEIKPQLGEIAERLGISNAAASRAFASLVERGYVTRREDEDDRRVKRLSIAPAGSEVVNELISRRRVGLERFLGRLDEGQRALLDEALRAIAERDRA